MMDTNPIATVAQPAVPVALIPFRQFVTWKLIDQPGKPKPAKVPFNPATGFKADPTNPATWADHATALAAYNRGGYNGIGFVFTQADPFVFVDLDDCHDPATGAYAPHANAIVQALPGAWELSQSGKGLHGVGMLTDPARLTDKRRKWTNESGQALEVYPHARFMAIGGSGWTGEPVVDWTESLATWVPSKPSLADFAPVTWIDQPRAAYDGPADDDDLIRRAVARQTAMSSIGARVSFAALWHADAQALGDQWPDDNARPFDHSSADLALCNALAWWTGCNPVRMLRLFQKSGLWRDDERKARLAIAVAINDPNRSYYSRAQRLSTDERIGDDLAAEAFPEILTLEQATSDMVFIGNGSMIVSRRSKRMRSKADALNEWAASKHTIDTGKLDKWGAPATKDVPVIAAWLSSNDRRGADVLAWVPGAPEFCAAPERQQAGDRAFNLWTQPIMMDPPDDWHERAGLFVQHVAYLVPIEAERTRFMQWLGHLFQHPGVLPHTAYLMFTPKTGTGRGTLASILTRALRGYVAANVSSDTLFGNFNGRLSMKLFATVDEIREGNSRERHSKEQQLRSKITEEYREINPKYGVRSVEKNCCRWLMFSNHADALPFDNTDRRIIVIENPSQCASAEWYGALHDAMDDPRFIASVQRYLSTLDLTGFNPHEHAPMNAAKTKALAALTTDAESSVTQFAQEWPGEFAFLSDLRSYVADERKGDDWCRHEAERAGMRIGRERFKVNGEWQRVLIVRGDLTPDEISDPAMRPQLRASILAARSAFSFGG